MAKLKYVINRRKVLAWGGTIGAALLGGNTLVRWLGKPTAQSEHSLIPEELLEQSFEKFSLYEAAVLHEVAGLIVPADQHSGAKEAMVIMEFDKIAKQSTRFKHLCHHGVRWLDAMADDMFQSSSFLKLSSEAQTKILVKADSSSTTLFGKIFDNLQYGEAQIGHKFFQTIRRQTFAVFYAHPMGWTTVGYHGPPQWSGHLDYHICV